jgi:hypothetical protein
MYFRPEIQKPHIDQKVAFDRVDREYADSILRSANLHTNEVYEMPSPFLFIQRGIEVMECNFQHVHNLDNKNVLRHWLEKYETTTEIIIDADQLKPSALNLIESH